MASGALRVSSACLCSATRAADRPRAPVVQTVHADADGVTVHVVKSREGLKTRPTASSAQR